mgnify:CR=1 FL=1
MVSVWNLMHILSLILLPQMVTVGGSRLLWFWQLINLLINFNFFSMWSVNPSVLQGYCTCSLFRSFWFLWRLCPVEVVLYWVLIPCTYNKVELLFYVYFRPSTFAQAAKLRRMAAAKEKELTKGMQLVELYMSVSYVLI